MGCKWSLVRIQSPRLAKGDPRVGRPFHFSSPPGTALLSRGHGNFSARAARSPAPRTGRYASGRKHPPRPSRTIEPHPRPKYQRCTKHGRAPAGRSFGQPPWHCGSSLCRTRNKKGGLKPPDPGSSTQIGSWPPGGHVHPANVHNKANSRMPV